MMVHSSSLTASLALIASTYAASLTPVTNFGPNPNNVLMNIYVPDKVSSSPPLIVAMHYCTGTAQAYYSGTDYARLADQYGYIVLYPEAPRSGKCWDVASSDTLTHDKGGDSLGIASAVRWASSKYKVPSVKVFATGTSSGAMMTNVLMGAYPDLFSGGAAFSGVGYGCFAGPNEWHNQCSDGKLVKTAQAWGDQVRSGYPGYTGKRPKLQEWHGTSDFLLHYANLAEENKQWSNVFGISFTRNETNNPLPGYTKMIYGDGTQYIAYSALNVGHTVPEEETIVLEWFGITGNGGSPTSSTSSPPIPKPTSTTLKASTTASAPPAGPTVGKWGQCGGLAWTGSLTCASGTTCTKINDYYHQCL